MLRKPIHNLFIVYFLINVCSSQNDPPEVVTPLGKVRGFWKTSTTGRKYAAFEGIPYAKPPVGDLRFEEAQPIQPWSGTWIADTLHICLQYGFSPDGELEGVEDCLFLNVYLPAEYLTNSKKLDVIVSIHGGAFMMGAGHTLTNSSHFLDRDVVLVTINYRVGILGFLSTEDEAVPGNNGLKDQVLALKWVKDNIASFGGKPDSSTIIGVSAGGVSVHLHYLSPLSRGLFHKGVSQSGTALVPWAIRRNPLQYAKKLAVLVGCPDDSTKELKSCLKQRPAQNLVKQLKHLYGYGGMLPFSPFAPTVEKASRSAFLDKEPYQLLKDGDVLDVPWITSIAADEGLLLSSVFWSNLEDIDEKWTNIVCQFLDCNETLPESRRETVSKKLLTHYLGSGEKIDKRNFMKFTKLLTDRLFGLPAEVSAKLQADVTKSPVYYYLLNYRKGENKMAHFYSRSDEIQGVAHGDDCIYCYGVFSPKPLSQQDERLRRFCLDMFYSFASTGKPSFDGTDTWQPTGSTELTYLNVTGPHNIKLQKSKDLSSNVFWNSLGILEYERLSVKDEL